MRSSFFSSLVNGPFGDPALFVRAAHRGEALLFDCGDLHPLSGRDLLKIQHVFISHAHIDHLIGFDHLLRHHLYRPTCLNFYGPPGIIEHLSHRLAGYTWNLVKGYPLEIRVREAAGEKPGRQARFRASEGFVRHDETPPPYDSGLVCETLHYRVRTRPLQHGNIVSQAYALEEKLHVAIHPDALDRLGYARGRWLTRFKDLLREGAAGDTPIEVPQTSGAAPRELPLSRLSAEIAHCQKGMKIAYITDCEPREENYARILDLAQGADLLAIEAVFAHHDLARARERNHLTARIAGELARRAGVGKLLPFHHSPRYQDRPQLLQEEALSFFSG